MTIGPAETSGRGGPWRDLWASRDILFVLSRREVLTRHKGSRLGLAWAVFQPILYLGIYTLAFGVILRTRWPESGGGILDYALAVYCGLVAYGLFSECASRAPTLLMENRHFVRRALFPVQVLPFCLVLSTGFHTLISLAVLVLAGWAVSGFHAAALLAPVVLLPLVLLTCGAVLLLAALGPVIRDLAQLIPPLLLGLFFLTPIVYSEGILPARLAWLARVNPLAFVTINLRHVVLGWAACDWRGWFLWMLLCGAFVAAAYAVFVSLRRAVSDWV